MLMIKKIHFVLTISFLILLPLSLSAQPSQVPDATWGSVDHFKYTSSGKSETFKNVKLSSNSIAVGKDITVINLDTCLLYTSPSPRDKRQSRMPSSA